jgi:hypothetical protein
MKHSLSLSARRNALGFCLRHLFALLLLAIIWPGVGRAEDDPSPGVKRNIAHLRREGWKVETLTNRYACSHPDLKVTVTIGRAPKRHSLLEGYNYLVTAVGKVALKPGRLEEGMELLRETLREKPGEFLYNLTEDGTVVITVGVSDRMLEWEDIDFLFETSCKSVANAMIRFRERARILAE